jgi:hypothetical protein
LVGRNPVFAPSYPPTASELVFAEHHEGNAIIVLAAWSYGPMKRGDLKRVKFGKRTLFYATDLAAFLTTLRRLSDMN